MDARPRAFYCERCEKRVGQGPMWMIATEYGGFDIVCQMCERKSRMARLTADMHQLELLQEFKRDSE